MWTGKIPKYSVVPIVLSLAANVMAQNANNAEREYLDKFYPIVDQGATPPGEWISRDGGRHWLPLPGFRTRHGQATVMWDASSAAHAWPISIDAAHLPDGTSVTVVNTYGDAYRHRAPGGRIWIHGRIEISPTEVAFIAGEQPVYQPLRPVGPSLEVDMANDIQLKQALQDDKFAQAMTWLLKDNEFLAIATSQKWGSVGRSHAAQIVAGLRGLGEIAADWKNIDPLPGIYPDFRADAEAQLRSELRRASELPRIPSLDELTKQMQAFWDRRAKNNPSRPPLTDDQKKLQIEDLHRQWEAKRPESERLPPDWEKMHSSTLASLQRRLANLDANADIYREIKLHLTRLGWRVETAADRRAQQKRARQQNLPLLFEVRNLEKRREGPVGGWVEELRQQMQQQKIDLPLCGRIQAST